MNLETLRARVLRTSIAVTAVAAPLVACFMVLRQYHAGTLTNITLALGAATLTFPLLHLDATRLDRRTAAAIYLALIVGMSFAIALRGGVSTSAAALQLLVVILSGLQFGARGAALGLAASLALFGVAGAAVVGGVVPPVMDSMWDPSLAAVWIRAGLVLTFFGGAVALAVTFIVEALEREARHLRESLVRERAERIAREAAEAERERVSAALAEARRLETLGRLASGIAHDYNNVLTVITAAADVAQQTPGLPRDVRECLDDITRAACRASELTRSLLVVGRRDAARPQPTNVAELIDQIRAGIERALPSRIRLVVNEACDGHVSADAAQLERVLLNLILNARDAIQDDGTIEISARACEIDGERELAPGRYVAIQVSDTGQGMDEEVMARSFEPFFTTKAPGQGTGIGLAFVRSFAADASGAARVTSRPGRGATVTVYLPEAGAPGIACLRRELESDLPPYSSLDRVAGGEPR